MTYKVYLFLLKVGKTYLKAYKTPIIVSVHQLPTLQHYIIKIHYNSAILLYYDIEIFEYYYIIILEY